MRATDFLRSLADLIDQTDGKEAITSPNKVELSPVKVDHTDNTISDTAVFPLQQKLELLKKATGVDNIYDKENEEEIDELEQLKHAAGINPATVFIASDDLEIE